MKSISSLRHLTTASKMSAYRKIKRCLLISFVKSAVVVVVLLVTIIVMSGKDIPDNSIKDDTSCMGTVLSRLGIICSSNIINAFVTAEHITGINRYMLVALAVTESGIRGSISSSKGYKGIMQVPVWTVSDEINIMTGAGILSKKIEVAGGDILKAIALYKGYGISRKGLEKAETVLTLYRNLIKLGEVEKCG